MVEDSLAVENGIDEHVTNRKDPPWGHLASDIQEFGRHGRSGYMFWAGKLLSDLWDCFRLLPGAVFGNLRSSHEFSEYLLRLWQDIY